MVLFLVQHFRATWVVRGKGCGDAALRFLWADVVKRQMPTGGMRTYKAQSRVRIHGSVCAIVVVGWTLFLTATTRECLASVEGRVQQARGCTGTAGTLASIAYAS